MEKDEKNEQENIEISKVQEEFEPKEETLSATEESFEGEFQSEKEELEPIEEIQNIQEEPESAQEGLKPVIEELEPMEEESQPTEEFHPLEEGIKEDIEEGPKDLITVRPVKFQQFEPSQPNRTIKRNLDIMQDVSMHISVELGRTKSSIREVMELEEGSIVELDKIAGEQVEVFVNEKLVAKGEVIVIEDKFGVRVTSTNIQKTI